MLHVHVHVHVDAQLDMEFINIMIICYSKMEENWVWFWTGWFWQNPRSLCFPLLECLSLECGQCTQQVSLWWHHHSTCMCPFVFTSSWTQNNGSFQRIMNKQHSFTCIHTHAHTYAYMYMYVHTQTCMYAYYNPQQTYIHIRTCSSWGSHVWVSALIECNLICLSMTSLSL